MAADEEAKLRHVLTEALSERNIDIKHMKVCRKVKDLKSGDFVVPRGALDIDVDSEELIGLGLQQKFLQETAQDTLPISTVKQDTYNSLVLHIDRGKAFRNIIKQVLSARDEYGCLANNGCRVILNPVDLSANNTSSQDGNLVTLTQLRGVILLKHVLELLIANGFAVNTAPSPVSDGVRDLLEALGVEKCPSSPVDLSLESKDIVSTAKASEWKEPASARTVAAGGDGLRDCVVLNVRRYAEAKGLPLGKNGYDQNLHLVDVVQEDGSISDVAMETAFLNRLHLENEQSRSPHSNTKNASDTWCVHIVSQSLAFRQQQAGLLWQMCSQSSHLWRQRHLVFGMASRRRSSTAPVVDAQKFYNLRHGQMTQAAMMKYGDHEQGPGWEDMISGLTAASITFDVLSTASLSQLQLDLSDGDVAGSVDNRSGPFVMYNCARLATLVRMFEENVQQGLYPDLPDPSEIDYCLLREEEEWAIAFLYLNAFPRLVHDAVGTFQQDEGITASIHTHKVAHFLLNFAKVLSSYYSRYHILGGSEAHLLPLMYARLSLMKAAHQVLCNGLQLLGLQPFSQL